MNWVRRWRVLFALVLFAVGCRERSHHDPGAVTLSVFAASSLTEAFGELERDFEAAHPGVDVQLTFAGSQRLRLQIEHGALVDVFASANAAHIHSLVASGHLTAPRVFAQNELVLIVPPGNPAGIHTLRELTKAKRIVIGTESVPVGGYTREMFARAASAWGEAFREQVRARVVSEETNVRLVHAKVSLGEADAAVVYRTDALASERVHRVALPPALNVRASYLFAAAAGSRHLQHAQQFLQYVLSEEGREVLRRRGFFMPEEQ